MSWVDLAIVAVIALSVITAFARGFLLELFSLAGVVLGLIAAAAWYSRLAPWFMRWTAHWAEGVEAANLAAFLLIAVGVMLAAALLGRLLRGTMRMVGLGFLDRLLGVTFGLIKGCVLVTLVVMAVTAFVPRSDWLKDSKLAPLFLAAAHDGSHLTAFEFGEKIRQGIQLLKTRQ